MAPEQDRHGGEAGDPESQRSDCPRIRERKDHKIRAVRTPGFRFRGNHLYFVGEVDGQWAIKRYSLKDDERVENIATNVNVPDRIIVSPDETKLAYRDYFDNDNESDIALMDIETGEIKIIHKGYANLSLWAEDSKSFFLTSKNYKQYARIEIGGKLQPLDINGILIKHFANDDIIYYRINENSGETELAEDVVFYKKNFSEEHEKVILKIESMNFLDASMSENGQFIIASYITKTGLFRAGNKPIVYDLRSETKYELPIFPDYTYCVFLTDK